MFFLEALGDQIEFCDYYGEVIEQIVRYVGKSKVAKCTLQFETTTNQP